MTVKLQQQKKSYACLLEHFFKTTVVEKNVYGVAFAWD